MDRIKWEKQEQAYRNEVMTEYINIFLKGDYRPFDKGTKIRNLMWCNLAKERDRIIATDELHKIRLQNSENLFFYLERTEELYITDFEAICRFLDSLEPWEEVDAAIFDTTMEWTIAVTHEDFAILIGV